MFKIIKDPELALQYQEAGLLWWVGEEGGGELSCIRTCDIAPGTGGMYVADFAPKGVFGILLED